MLSSKNKKILGCVIVVAVILFAGIYLHNCRVHLSRPVDEAALPISELTAANAAGETNYVVLSYWLWQDGGLNCPFRSAAIRDAETGEAIPGSFAMACKFAEIGGSTPSVDHGSLTEIESKYKGQLISMEDYVSQRDTRGASVLLFIPVDEYEKAEGQAELELAYSVLGGISKEVTIEI